MYLKEKFVIEDFAKKYYDDETYKHAKRVADYATSQPLLPTSMITPCYYLGLCHDLYEDTDIPREIFSGDLEEGIQILTRKKDETYNQYLLRIRDRADKDYVGDIAYRVKIADLKDHLAQADTLSDSLKERYVKGLITLL